MQKFDLKKQFTDGYGWNKDFKFEIIFSNSGNYKKEGEMEFYLSGGVGFSSIKDSFESIAGNELTQIYSGKNSNIYEIKFK